jgi:hypothetical protein
MEVRADYQTNVRYVESAPLYIRIIVQVLPSLPCRSYVINVRNATSRRRGRSAHHSQSQMLSNHKFTCLNWRAERPLHLLPGLLPVPAVLD